MSKLTLRETSGQEPFMMRMAILSVGRTSTIRMEACNRMNIT